MTGSPTPKKKPAPGWYSDPKMADTRRYWDGNAWSDNRVPATPLTSPAPVTDEKSQRARNIAAALLVFGAASVWFGLAPDNSIEEVRASIESDDDANNARTEGAPQQQVVNGWTTIEYLSLLSEQQEASDNRRDGLLVLALVAGAVVLAKPKGATSKA